MELNKEELLALLESEEAQGILAERFVPKGDFDSVNSKREQLLGEKKREQKKAENLKSELEKFEGFKTAVGELGFDMDETFTSYLTDLKRKAENPDGGEADEGGSGEARKVLEDRLVVQKDTYESKLAAQKKTYEDKLDGLQTALDATVSGWYTEKIENTLNSELDRIDVLPKHKKLLKDAFRTRAEVLEDEDGVHSVLVTNENGLKVSAQDFFDAFAQSEDGKSYIASQPTGGGGAPGGKGTRKVDYAQERSKALREGNVARSTEIVLAEWRAKNAKRR